MPKNYSVLLSAYAFLIGFGLMMVIYFEGLETAFLSAGWLLIGYGLRACWDEGVSQAEK